MQLNIIQDQETSEEKDNTYQVYQEKKTFNPYRSQYNSLNDMNDFLMTTKHPWKPLHENRGLANMWYENNKYSWGGNLDISKKNDTQTTASLYIIFTLIAI